MSRNNHRKTNRQPSPAPVKKEEQTRNAAGSQSLFFSSAGTRDFSSVLRDVQAHISAHYAGLITDGGNEEQKE